MTERVPAEMFSPGDYIKEFLADRGWTQNDLADILGRPVQLVSDIILDKRGITPETAKGLAEAFDTNAQLWLNLDSAWQLYKTRSTAPDPAIGLRARIYSAGPIKEMVRRGWLEHSSNPEVLEQRILEFLEIDTLDDDPVTPIAARMSAPYNQLTPSQRAWVCRARHLARAMLVESKFSARTPAGLMNELRALLLQPEEVNRVPQVLAEHGIRFLILQHLDKTKIDGACLWLDKASPVIVLSMRYDRIDYFWFTLMHELWHAFNGDGQDDFTVDVQLVGEGAVDKDSKLDFERRADELAEDTLIHQDKLQDFIVRKGPLFSERDIRGFASLHELHPGLVVGQLHHKLGTYAKFRHLLVKVREYITQSALTDGWGHRVPAIS